MTLHFVDGDIGMISKNGLHAVFSVSATCKCKEEVVSMIFMLVTIMDDYVMQCHFVHI